MAALFFETYVSSDGLQNGFSLKPTDYLGSIGSNRDIERKSRYGLGLVCPSSIYQLLSFIVHTNYMEEFYIKSLNQKG
jgi:hypothetical protein